MEAEYGYKVIGFPGMKRVIPPLTPPHPTHLAHLKYKVISYKKGIKMKIIAQGKK